MAIRLLARNGNKQCAYKQKRTVPVSRASVCVCVVCTSFTLQVLCVDSNTSIPFHPTIHALHTQERYVQRGAWKWNCRVQNIQDINTGRKHCPLAIHCAPHPQRSRGEQEQQETKRWSQRRNIPTERTKPCQLLPEQARRRPTNVEQGCKSALDRWTNECLNNFVYSQICNYSQEWANELSKRKILQHRHNREYSENLFWHSSTRPLNGTYTPLFCNLISFRFKAKSVWTLGIRR